MLSFRVKSCNLLHYHYGCALRFPSTRCNTSVGAYLLSRLPRKSNGTTVEKKKAPTDLMKDVEKTFKELNNLLRRQLSSKSQSKPKPPLPHPKASDSGSNNDSNKKSSGDDFVRKNIENVQREIERERTVLKYSLILFLMITVPALYNHNFCRESRAVEISYREFVNSILLSKKSDSDSSSYDEPFLSLTILDDSKVFVNNHKLENGKDCFFYILNSIDFEKHLKETLNVHGLDEKFVQISHSNSLIKLTRLGVLLIAAYVWIFMRLVMFFFRPSTMPRLSDLAKSRLGSTLPTRAIERKNYIPVKSEKRFSDVIGYKEQKQELMEFVDFLKDPKKYHEIGAKIPRGALLYGPPGTGKTLIAKAVAGEAGVNFFSAAGSEFQQLFIGVGPQRIKDLFDDASNAAPSIIFIDEIDSIAMSRARNNKNSHTEGAATLNQLLALMDGFKTNKDVVVLAATNRFDQLDPAVLRPGRFDRHILFGSPDLESRCDMFKYYLQRTPLEDSIEHVANRMALMTTGFVGADISLICNEGAIFAARDNSNVVKTKDFEKAIDRVIVGSKSSIKLQPHERQIVSLREAAKAVMAWFNKDAQPILKVSIVPRGQELAYSQKYVKEEYLTNKEKLDAALMVLLSGRAAEDVILNQLYSVAGDELLKITDLVYKQVGVFGMGDSVKNVSFQSLSLESNSLFPVRPEYNQLIQDDIDNNVRAIIDSAYERTKKFVIQHKDLIFKLARFLNEHEQANNNDLISILGARPYTDDILRRIDN